MGIVCSLYVVNDVAEWTVGMHGKFSQKFN